jgi:tRNA-dihydrouridine synthase
MICILAKFEMHNEMIYLAPIQGFTDFVYRKVYSMIFNEVDTFFIPYISIKNNQILKKYKREVLPENNLQKKVIPQVLIKDSSELLYLSKLLYDLGYNEINLNLGCPYPMVTNRGKGAGLLPYAEKIKIILSDFFNQQSLKLSVKLRAGLESPKDIETIIPVLNEFPLTEVILHARIAKQLYKGKIKEEAFLVASKFLKHKLVYNGDVFTINDYKIKSGMFPEIQDWMLGRGILMNPFLPAEIQKISNTKEEKFEKLQLFHHSVFEEYIRTLDNDGNTLNKMKQFWIYFSYNFRDQNRIFKAITKTRNLSDYKIQTRLTFNTMY